MTEYYFDIETTGINFDTDEIITIQFQRLNGLTGEPIDELHILKSWETSEREILEQFIPNLFCRRWDFIFAGKNLMFDFCFLSHKIKQHNLGEFDLHCIYDRAFIDIKHLLVLMNKGNFIGYNKVIPTTNPLANEEIPKLYRNNEFSKIVQYIKYEAREFTRAYQIIKKEIPLLRNFL